MKTVRIKGAVIANDMKDAYNWMGWDSVAPSDVESVIAESDEDEPLEVDISSDGGVVTAATEIYSMLKAHKGPVTVNIQGLAASSATIIAMAGDTVNISPVGQMMIHKASVLTQGNADDLRSTSEALDATDQTIINAYQIKTGLKRDELLKMMSDTTWLTAQDAVDKGFADSITDGSDEDVTPLLTNSGNDRVTMMNTINHKIINKIKPLLDENKKLKNELNNQVEDKVEQDEKPTSLLQKKLAILNQK